MLLDEGSGRREYEDLRLLSTQDLGCDQGRDDGLAEPGRKHDEQVIPKAHPGEVDLEGQGANNPRSQVRVLDHSIHDLPDPGER